MAQADSDPRSGRAELPARRWLFASAELDERTLELKVSGEVQLLERKSLEVLLHLLHHAGEVVTRDELLEAVWPGRILTDSSVTSCVAKLRSALGDENQEIIKTAHGYGYRLVAPVRVEAITAPPPPRFDFKPGDAPPLRPNWALVERLGTGGHGEVWLARHLKTREERVFKFALDSTALASLKREITIGRLLRDALGDRPDFVEALDWNLEEPPYFLESERAGVDLSRWAEAQGGLATVPLAARLEIAAQIAETLAAAHSVGVLHKDLKPANVLVVDREGASRQIKLADFGSGGVVDPDRLETLGITRLGFTRTLTERVTSGTPIYFAPEVIGGQPFTVKADVYALGVLTYQLLVGQLGTPLATGWERNVDDPLLREDVAASTEGNPALRLSGAAELATRLRMLSQRRRQRDAERELAEQARLAQVQAEQQRAEIGRLKARRRWLLALVSVLVAGLATSLSLFFYGQSARAEAEQSAAVAKAVVEFLTGDLLSTEEGRSGVVKKEITVRELLDRAAPKVNQRFAADPDVAAEVQMAIGWAYDSIGDAEAGKRQIEHARNLRVKAAGPIPDWQVALLFVHLALDEAMPNFCDEIDAARKRGIQTTRFPSIARQAGVSGTFCDMAQGQGYEESRAELQRMYDDALRANPPDHEAAMEVANGLAGFSYWAGDFEAAERYKRSELENKVIVMGESHRDVIRTRLTLAHLLSVRGKYAEAELELNESRTRVAEDQPERERFDSILATLMLEQGRLDEAGTLLRTTSGAVKDPRSRASRLYLLGEVNLRQGRVPEALDTLREALAAIERLGPTNPIRATDDRQKKINIVVALADALRQQGETGKAAAVLDSVRPDLLALPPRHPLGAAFGRVRGLLHLAERKPELARAELTEAAAIYDTRLGPEHWRTRRVRQELALLTSAG